MLILNIITFANLVFLFCLLFFRKNNALPNKILALILIDPGINFISNVNTLSGNFYNFPYLFFFAQITCFAFAPLVHIYTYLLLGEKPRLKHPLYWITILAMLMCFGFAIQYKLADEDVQKVYLNGLMNEPYPVQMEIINYIFIGLQQVYFTAAAIKIYNYRKKLADSLSNYDKTKVLYATKFIVLIWIFNLITIGLYATLPITTVEYLILPLVVTGIYFFLLYYSYHHNSVFTNQSYREFLEENPVIEDDITEVSTQKLPDEEILKLAQDIETHLITKEPYSNPNLSLDILSEKMNVPAGKLSVAINKGLNKKFYDLINEKRVEKSKLLLQQEIETTTIEYVAYKSGFNSRASFYRAFKKHTNITPKEYLKSLDI